MPEFAELHHSAHQLAAASAGYTFRRVLTRGIVRSRAGTLGVGDHVASPLVELAATASWGDLHLFARHRGKEVGVVLAEQPRHCNHSRQCPSVLSHFAKQAGPCCVTCDAIGSARAGAVAGSGDLVPLAPKCEHGEVCKLQQVKKSSANKGRWFFSCALGFGRKVGRCNFFKWADDVSGALPSEPGHRACMDAFFDETEHIGRVQLPGAVEADGTAGNEMPQLRESQTCSVRVARLTFRRGMKGRFVVISKDELARAEEAEALLNQAHVVFERCDGAMLAFLDRRPRTSESALWHQGLWGPLSIRGPDPVGEFSLFCANIVASLDVGSTQPPSSDLVAVEGGDEGGGRGNAADTDRGAECDSSGVWERPICEALLDQRFFNGVGNYLRAEILWQAKVAPFERARDVLSRCRAEARARGAGSCGGWGRRPAPALKGGDGRGGEKGEERQSGGGESEAKDFLSVVRDVLVKAVMLHGDKRWLSVFRKRYSNKEVDSLGRIIWYRGARGALPGPEVVHSPWHSLTFQRLPLGATGRALELLTSVFGACHVTHNVPKRYAFVRFPSTEAAVRAKEALAVSPMLQGCSITFKRRIRAAATSCRDKSRGHGRLPGADCDEQSAGVDAERGRNHSIAGSLVWDGTEGGPLDQAPMAHDGLRAVLEEEEEEEEATDWNTERGCPAAAADVTAGAAKRRGMGQGRAKRKSDPDRSATHACVGVGGSMAASIAAFQSLSKKRGGVTTSPFPVVAGEADGHQTMVMKAAGDRQDRDGDVGESVEPGGSSLSTLLAVLNSKASAN